MKRRRWCAAASLILGLIALAAAVFHLRHDPFTPRSFGPSAAAAPSTAAARATGPARPPRTAASPPAASPPASQVASEPVRLELPTLSVSAAVRQVVTTNGVLGVPDNPADVGWWTGSVPPGATQGTTVIDGHVDSAATGIGALFYLDRLQAGDTVTLTTGRGDNITYRVYARHVYDKSQGLPADLFTTTGPARLVLITCGGPFDAAEHSYLDNIAVFATPQTAH